jgi:hypothetical protein
MLAGFQAIFLLFQPIHAATRAPWDLSHTLAPFLQKTVTALPN